MQYASHLRERKETSLDKVIDSNGWTSRGITAISLRSRNTSAERVDSEKSWLALLRTVRGYLRDIAADGTDRVVTDRCKIGL